MNLKKMAGLRAWAKHFAEIGLAAVCLFVGGGPALASVTVNLTAPTNGTVYVTPPANITVSATASAGQGYTLSKVEFFHGGTNLIASDTTAPYGFDWTNVSPGTYAITAVATAVKKNSPNQTATSATATVIVNSLPSVSISSPPPNSVFPAGVPLVPIGLTSNATDLDGTISSVQYYHGGGNLIGTANSAPYAVGWSGMPAGTYSITAVATDNRGATTTSSAVPITVTQRPTVIILSPQPQAVFAAPANVTATAAVFDPDGSIASVVFSGPGAPITVTTPPYTATWQNVPQGFYIVSVTATDNLGVTNIFPPPVQFFVTDPPTVALTSPSNNAVFGSPANITLTASASDSGGSISKVEFFQGTTLLATVTSPPYTHTHNNVTTGQYTYTAKATDNQNIPTTSAPVSVTVNNAPTVAITSPTNNASFNAPASIVVTADAQDGDGTITQVELLQGTTLITTLTSAPYTHTLNNVTAGNYTFTARATDNLGGITTSDPVSVIVTAVGGQIYFMHTDHLNTPRLVTNSTGQAVWRWDNTDPFGGNSPDENPSGLGAFVFDLGFPGQVRDRETGLWYNGQRDAYDAAIGSYTQPEPIGLAGDINLYRYARSNPLSNYDPNGEQAAPAPGLPIPLPPVFIPGTQANQAFVNSVNQLIKKIKEICETDDSADCERASSFQLRAAGITNEHDFKAEYVGPKGVSRYDICACKDGSIKIAQVGRCGFKGPKIDTYARWR